MEETKRNSKRQVTNSWQVPPGCQLLPDTGHPGCSATDSPPAPQNYRLL